MSEKIVTYVGLDVHKSGINVAMIGPDSKVVDTEWQIANESSAVGRMVRKPAASCDCQRLTAKLSEAQQSLPIFADCGDKCGMTPGQRRDRQGMSASAATAATTWSSAPTRGATMRFSGTRGNRPSNFPVPQLTPAGYSSRP